MCGSQGEVGPSWGGSREAPSVPSECHHPIALASFGNKRNDSGCSRSTESLPLQNAHILTLFLLSDNLAEVIATYPHLVLWFCKEQTDLACSTLVQRDYLGWMRLGLQTSCGTWIQVVSQLSPSVAFRQTGMTQTLSASYFIVSV